MESRVKSSAAWEGSAGQPWPLGREEEEEEKRLLGSDMATHLFSRAGHMCRGHWCLLAPLSRGRVGLQSVPHPGPLGRGEREGGTREKVPLSDPAWPELLQAYLCP